MYATVWGLGLQVRIDMSEYMEKHAVSRLIGAPPGYVFQVFVLVLILLFDLGACCIDNQTETSNAACQHRCAC